MNTKFLILGLILASLNIGCAGINDPYAPAPYGGYDNSYDRYDSNRDHRDDYYRQRDYDRKQDLKNERRRLEEERERLERERQENLHHHRVEPRREEHCPSGFSPSERKCSADERRKGCKDMRLPGGLGCVSR